MIESLRGLGYSAPTAIADLIDNSISAGAGRVDLLFHWEGSHSHIRILDDGDGMNDPELDKAMRLGERSPKDSRASGDLGRFGLGMKTASFSQCRRLTVASKKDGTTSCLRWDLDVLARSEDNGWHLLEGPHPGSSHLLEVLGNSAGTLVVWEEMDRIVAPGFMEQDFLDLMDRVEQHLAMVFHRYLEGTSPKLGLTINGRPIAPWDPFLARHPATSSSPVERIPTASGIVEAQWHVLPHKDKLDPRTHESSGGRDGWTAQQGFYVYRNERLLLAGSWLGLGQGRPWSKEEAYRLARIRVDIPNTADEDWRIDIRKSVARPPVAIRMRLTRLAEDAREHARRVFAHRGQTGRGRQQSVIQAWRVDRSDYGIRYRIDESHPAIKGVMDEAGPLLPALKAMLRVIEETVPVQRIWLDTTEAHETPRTGFSGEPAGEIAAVLGAVFRNLVERRGYQPEEARERLIKTEPFNNFPELVRALGKPRTEGDRP
ncbi:MAG: ATP-binding protein [Holophaga sp.]|nr:ATP-binding protein [Holophaga sp.]